MLAFLILGIFIAIVFGKSGVALMKGLISLVFGAMLLMIAGALF